MEVMAHDQKQSTFCQDHPLDPPTTFAFLLLMSKPQTIRPLFSREGKEKLRQKRSPKYRRAQKKQGGGPRYHDALLFTPFSLCSRDRAASPSRHFGPLRSVRIAREERRRWARGP